MTPFNRGACYKQISLGKKDKSGDIARSFKGPDMLGLALLFSKTCLSN